MKIGSSVYCALSTGKGFPAFERVAVHSFSSAEPNSPFIYH